MTDSYYLSPQRAGMDYSFGRNIIPSNEKERLKALYACNMLDKEADLYFRSMVQIMGISLAMPIAIISLVDHDRVYCMASNVEPPVLNAPRGWSLCSLVILGNKPLVFENTMEDPSLCKNPFVCGPCHLRFYAGAPLITRSGHNLGTVCVLDSKPRQFSDMDKDLLVRYAETVTNAIEKRMLGAIPHKNWTKKPD